jgi:hypothetical protein
VAFMLYIHATPFTSIFNLLYSVKTICQIPCSQIAHIVYISFSSVWVSVPFVIKYLYLYMSKISMKYRLLNSPSPKILFLIGSSSLMSECGSQRTHYKLFDRTGALRCTRGKVTVVCDCSTLREKLFMYY